MGLIPTYMIIIKDDPVAEYYASITLPEWKRLGYGVKRFDAYTPDKLPTEFKLDFGMLQTKKYVNRGIQRTHTPTEQACWYSHTALWREAVKQRTSIMVIEQDAYPFYPDLIDITTDADFVTYDKIGFGCYIISYKLAKHLWSTFGVQKKPVRMGPYGYIHDLSRHMSSVFKMVNMKSKEYLPAVHQLFDPDVGANIDHFTGTGTEHLRDEMLYERVLLTKGQKPDISKLIYTTVG